MALGTNNGRVIKTIPTLLITTDHGRGKDKSWTSHGSLIRGSSETWLAMIGPGLQPLGEISEEQQLYQKQIAKMIAELVGEKFEQRLSIVKDEFLSRL